MRIGLIDVDGKNFPNLALMKLSRYHKNRGDDVEFFYPINGRYDIVYKSKVFTFSSDYPYLINAERIINGGTGYKLFDDLDPEIENLCPDYDLYGLRTAYGFLTRGCIRKCDWCIVPQKEGFIKPAASIGEILGGFKQAVLMDNNVLASEWGLSQIEMIVKLGIKIDFNQGLDARLIANNKDIALLLSKCKWIRFIRLSCDTIHMIDPVLKSVELIRKFSKKKGEYFIYVLVKNIEESKIIVEKLQDYGLTPFAQPYRSYDNNNSIDMNLKRFSRWVNHKAIFNTVKFNEYI